VSTDRPTRWLPDYDHVKGFWYVRSDNGVKIRHGRRNAFVTRFKTCAAAQATADRLNASYKEGLE
jgi:hypothetical protein